MKKPLKLAMTICFLLAINSYADNMGVDPTKPPEHLVPANKNTSGNFTLSAIFSRPNHRVAIINKTVVQVGDKIDDFSVTSITENTVELVSSDGEKRTLSLSPSIKNPR